MSFHSLSVEALCIAIFRGKFTLSDESFTHKKTQDMNRLHITDHQKIFLNCIFKQFVTRNLLQKHLLVPITLLK